MATNQFGIAAHTLIPSRKEAQETSEMVTQILFGETYEILERKEGWLKVETHEDNYQCWIDEKMHTPLTAEELQQWNEAPHLVATESIKLATEAFHHLWVSPGSILPKHQFNSEHFQVNAFLHPNKKQDLKLITKEWLHVPYLWGGKSVFGVDCSGLMQCIYRGWGINLKRDASQQYLQGTEISLAESQYKDLAFFEKNGKITHVGMLISKNEILHASGYVRIDTIDEKGIYSQKEKRHTHTLAGIRRI